MACASWFCKHYILKKQCVRPSLIIKRSVFMSPFFTSPEVAAYYLYVEAENFPTSQSWRVLQSWYTGGGPEQGFGAISQMDLTGSLVPSVVQVRLFKLSAKVGRNNVTHDLTSYSQCRFFTIFVRAFS